MDREYHCQRSKETFEQDYGEIHDYIDRHFDWVNFRKFSCLTDGDWYPNQEVPDFYKHRKIEHHREGIELIVEHFRGKYPHEIVRKVAELHIRDDYGGYLPSKKDFSDPEFLKKYHK
jgi:hypothetical protein